MLAADGNPIHKQIGPSPLELRFDVPPAAVGGASLSVRFATTTARGRLSGRLSVIPPKPVPTTDAEKGGSDRVKTPELVGPGRCLLRGGRPLLALAHALESGDRLARNWSSEWCELTVERLSGDQSVAQRRRALDGLWEQLSNTKAPDAATARGVRQLLAGIENLLRREQTAKSQPARERAAAQVQQLLDVVACVTND